MNATVSYFGYTAKITSFLILFICLNISQGSARSCQYSIQCSDSSEAVKTDSSYATIYGIRFPLYGNWKKVTDSDFPEGAIILDDERVKNEEVFVSAIPVGKAGDEIDKVLSLPVTGKRSVDGRTADVIELDSKDKEVHVMFILFDDLTFEGSKMIMIAFGPNEIWDSVLPDVEELLNRTVIE